MRHEGETERLRTVAGVRRMSNWKATRPDGVRDSGSRNFPTCTRRLSEGLQECLSEGDVT